MTAFLAVVAAVYLIGYYLSLQLHPYTKCRVCNGTGRHWGAIFRYARRPCHRCFGTSTKQRFGARMLKIGTPRPWRPWGRWAPPSSEFPPPTPPPKKFGLFY